jgi:hypothetical protein
MKPAPPSNGQAKVEAKSSASSGTAMDRLAKPEQPAGAQPRVAALRRDTQVLLDELARRVSWVRKLPTKARVEVREHRGQMLLLLAGGLALGGAVLGLWLMRRQREQRPLRVAARKLKALGGLIAYPEKVVEPPLRVNIARSALATAMATVTGETMRRVLQRLSPRQA